jgi:CO dehydrogenase nickel-insertion accessory protein CooC1
MGYKCSKCGLGVIVTPNEMIRGCSCKKTITKKYFFGLFKKEVETDQLATVIMDMDAVAYGKSHISL